MKRLFLKALPLVLAILCAACTKRSEIPDSFDGTVYLENGTRIELIKVVPGTYTIGLPAESVFSAADVPRRDVAVEKEYWLGKYEITIEQWDAVMGGHEKYSGNGVLFVNWKNCAFAKATREKAAMFIDRLNTLYADRLPDGYRFDLPTEEQWEIACRAGTTTRYPWGDAVELKKAAMVAFPEIEKSGTVRTIIRFLLAYSRSRKFVLRSRLSLKVGRYPANNWGFHDMIGNVSELCQDSPAIPAPPDADGHAAGNDGAVVRGGDWSDIMSVVSSSRRKRASYSGGSSSSGENQKQPVIGFRLALLPVPADVHE